jgi:hypothetical protein
MCTKRRKKIFIFSKDEYLFKTTLSNIFVWLSLAAAPEIDLSLTTSAQHATRFSFFSESQSF